MAIDPQVDWAASLANLQREVEELQRKIARGPLVEYTSTYTPALTASTTNPTLGSGSAVAGRYWRDGEWIVAEFAITFGTSGTSAGSGNYLVSLPVNMSADHAAFASIQGAGALFDSSTGANPPCTFSRNSTGHTLRIHVGTAGIAAAAVPWTWAASDSIRGTVRYRPA